LPTNTCYEPLFPPDIETELPECMAADVGTKRPYRDCIAWSECILLQTFEYTGEEGVIGSTEPNISGKGYHGVAYHPAPAVILENNDKVSRQNGSADRLAAEMQGVYRLHQFFQRCLLHRQPVIQGTAPVSPVQQEITTEQMAWLIFVAIREIRHCDT